jgi:hypothetical protein
MENSQGQLKSLDHNVLLDAVKPDKLEPNLRIVHLTRNEYRKKYSTSFTIKEIKIKTTLKF